MNTLDQARDIFDTIHMLRMDLVRRHGAMALVEEGACPLTPAQMNAVRAIREAGQATVKELAETLEVSAPSASVMVERLVELGMASREQSRQDRREVIIRLTPQGRDTAEKTEQFVLGAIAEMLEELGPEYAHQWSEVFARIREILARRHGIGEAARHETGGAR
jgi:DNA-binding MarR family transcriptional regulator